jgi:hypothetical protein
MDKFLETQNLPRLNHKEIGNLNRPVSNTISNQKSPKKEKPESDGFIVELERKKSNYFSLK